MQAAIGSPVQQDRTQSFDPLRRRRIEEVHQRRPQGSAQARAEPKQVVEFRAGGGFRRDFRIMREQPGRAGLAQIENLIPIATPPRRFPPPVLNTTKGRFWIGKSGCPFALSTQLRRFTSWLASIMRSFHLVGTRPRAAGRFNCHRLDLSIG
jgi:hypothetical protein